MLQKSQDLESWLKEKSLWRCCKTSRFHNQSLRIEYLLKKPQKLEFWLKAKSLGYGCQTHNLDGAGCVEISFYRMGCHRSEWYEKKHCKFVQGWRIVCRICKDFSGDCINHKVEFRTDKVVVLSKIVNYFDGDSREPTQETFIYVFDLHSDGSFSFMAKDIPGWLGRTLNHIRQYGMRAKKDILS